MYMSEVHAHTANLFSKDRMSFAVLCRRLLHTCNRRYPDEYMLTKADATTKITMASYISEVTGLGPLRAVLRIFGIANRRPK